MARVVRWEPLREVAALQNEMGRMMNSMFTGLANGEGRSWTPPVDAWETETEVVYAFDLPGMPKDKIGIELDEGTLTVSGERERTEESSGDYAYRYERRFGSFARTIGLPSGVGEQDVNADYHDGVLEVRVAKPETPKPRRIQIGNSETATIEGTAKKA